MKVRIYLHPLSRYADRVVHTVVRLCRMEGVDYAEAERTRIVRGEIPDHMIDLTRSMMKSLDYVLLYETEEGPSWVDQMKENLRQARENAEKANEAGLPKVYVGAQLYGPLIRLK